MKKSLISISKKSLFEESVMIRDLQYCRNFYKVLLSNFSADQFLSEDESTLIQRLAQKGNPILWKNEEIDQEEYSLFGEILSEFTDQEIKTIGGFC